MTGMQRTTEQHHALGAAASHLGGGRAGVTVEVQDLRMAKPRPACAIAADATFGTWNHPRRLVGFVP